MQLKPCLEENLELQILDERKMLQVSTLSCQLKPTKKDLKSKACKVRKILEKNNP
jgi:hypothetical protein